MRPENIGKQFKRVDLPLFAPTDRRNLIMSESFSVIDHAINSPEMPIELRKQAIDKAHARIQKVRKTL